MTLRTLIERNCGNTRQQRPAQVRGISLPKGRKDRTLAHRGVTEFLRVAKLCAARDIPLAPHHVPHFNLQLAAGMPSGRWVETFDNAKQRVAWPDLFPGFPEVVDGRMVVPDRPGWGMEISDDIITRHAKLVRWRT